MTSTATPRNALDLVVEDPESAPAVLTTALSESGALDQPEDPDDGKKADPIHVRAAKHMRTQIAEHIAGILVQLPITDMLVGGWTHLGKVNKAKEETAKDGSSRTVAVGHHELTVRHDPQIDLVVDRVPVPLLKLFFDVVFTIGPSVFEIAAGKIAKATPGPISVKAVLSSNKVKIIERSTPTVDPRGLWKSDFDGPFVIEQVEEAIKPEPTKSRLTF
jgi:hypothetical protein